MTIDLNLLRMNAGITPIKAEGFLGKYLKPLTPLLITILPLYFATEEKWAKVNWEQYITMLFGILIPIFITDLIDKQEFLSNIVTYIKNKASRDNARFVVLQGGSEVLIQKFLGYIIDKRVHCVRLNDSNTNSSRTYEIYPVDAENIYVTRSNLESVKKINVGSSGLSCTYENAIIQCTIDGLVFYYIISNKNNYRTLSICTDNMESLLHFMNTKMIQPTEEKNTSNVVSLGKTVNVGYSTSTIQKNFISGNMNKLVISAKNKEALIKEITLFQDPKRMAKKHMLSRKNKMNIALHGLPGTGKTTLAMAVASHLKKDVLFVNKENPDEFFDNMQSIGLSNTVLVFDDIDFWNMKERKEQIVTKELDSKEQSKKTNGVGNVLLMRMMQLLDGYNIPDGCVCIITTNHIDDFDPALFRSGRITLNLAMSEMTDVYMYETLMQNIYETSFKDKIGLDQLEKILAKKFTLSHISNNVVMNNIDSYEGFVQDLLKLIE
jgi:chaperone BCS1